MSDIYINRNNLNTQNRSFFINTIFYISIFIILQIVILILYVGNSIDFLGRSNISQAIFGAIIGMSLFLSFATILFSYKKYKEKVEYKFEKLIKEIDIKYKILGEEIERQKTNFNRKHNYDADSQKHNEILLEFLKNLTEEEIYLEESKIAELKKAFEKAQNSD